MSKSRMMHCTQLVTVRVTDADGAFADAFKEPCHRPVSVTFPKGAKPLEVDCGDAEGHRIGRREQVPA